MTFDEYLATRVSALLRFATVVACDPHLAEDVVQDVLVRAHGRWSRIAAMEQPEAYLKRMVVNECLRSRRRTRRTVLLAHDSLDAASPRLLDHAGAYGERDDLARRIAALPPKQRAVVALRYYDGRTDAEIAEYLGCREGTVRAHASRALATLRAALSPSTVHGRS
ncbi:SigE family RNA polymerase sigma factor [Luedemannella helvata]|uniref:SigE family RNA polymerase sigma factor n=1 Tax=Luedemannella helvata TaxID=349315 RepID=A0ABP4WC12_9ACTN